MDVRYLIATYWQVYAAMLAAALAAFWAGWGACYLCWRPVITRHRPPGHARRAELEQLPPALPEQPPLVAAAMVAAHANAMARTAPREPRPLAWARARVAAVVNALGMMAAARTSWETASPWSDPPGTFTALVAAQDQDPA